MNTSRLWLSHSTKRYGQLTILSQAQNPCPQDIAVRKASKASEKVFKGAECTAAFHLEFNSRWVGRLFAQLLLNPPVSLCQRIKV